MSWRRLFLVAVLTALVPSCGGGGGSPSGNSGVPPATPPTTGSVVVTLVDGEGAPVNGAALKVDGTPRAPRVPGGNVFELERALVRHSLDVEREGFLLHQNFVPDRDRALDLFEVPADGSKAWIRTFLYDGVISRNGTLARLLRPVSIVRGASISPDAWARVRAVWEEAAERMSDVTGYPFRLADQAELGTITYTAEINAQLSFAAYFEWTGTNNVIEHGVVSFRTAAGLGQFSLVLHELTHGFGLSHSDRTTDVMHPSAVSPRHSDRELLVIGAVRRRPANTSFEDNVRDATSAIAAGKVSRSYSCGEE
jgi:hypothetical protein